MNLLQKQLAWLRGSNAQKARAVDVFSGGPGAAVARTRVVAERLVGAAGDNDIYTVPAGRYAIINGLTSSNPTGGAITRTFAMVINGVTVRPFSGATAVGAGGAASLGVLSGFLLAAGDTVRSIDSAPGLVHIASGMEGDASLVPGLVRLDGTNLSTTPKKIFEDPQGRAAFIGTSPAGNSSPNIAAVNDSGGARTVSFYMVPTGQSVAAQYLVAVTGSLTSGGNGTSVQIPMLPEGYALWAVGSADGAGLHCRGFASVFG